MKLPGKQAGASRLGLAGIRFEARGGQQEKLLSWCMAHGVPLQKIQADETGFTAHIAAADYPKLHIPARRCRTRLRIIRRTGGWFSLRKVLARPGLLLGPWVFLLVLSIGGRFLWSTRFVNVPTGKQKEIRQILQKGGLWEGADVSSEKLQNAQRELLAENENWGWIALNFYKGRLVVECTNANQALPVIQNDWQPYIAAADAVILENRVESGFPQKEPGQTAAAGEILIAAERPARDGTPVMQKTQGQVIGQIEREYTAMRPLQEDYTGLTGNVSYGYQLKTPFGTLQVGRDEKHLYPGVTKTYYEPLTLAGLAFPATLMIQETQQTAQMQRTLPREAARQFARYICYAQLYKEFPDAKILAQSVQEHWQEDTLCYTMRVIFCANIAHKADSA